MKQKDVKKFDIFAKFVESTDILKKAYLEEWNGAGEKDETLVGWSLRKKKEEICGKGLL